MRKKCYLAGAITGLSFDDGQNWRQTAKTLLYEMGIDGYSPLRGKSFLRKLDVIPAIPNTTKPMSTGKGIVTRDVYDVTSSDAVLINVLGAKTVSIGTVMEIAIGHVSRKPMVLVMEEGNIHEHPFVLEMVGYRVDTLQDGIDIIGNILLP
jgi:nucleoside 2-deoxyribosyltransferase